MILFCLLKKIIKKIYKHKYVIIYDDNHIQELELFEWISINEITGITNAK
jgi:hypothetical protein